MPLGGSDAVQDFAWNVVSLCERNRNPKRERGMQTSLTLFEGRQNAAGWEEDFSLVT
jgi:hypothetical protein